MILKKATLFIALLTLFSYQTLTESCEVYTFVKQEGKALANHVIKTISRAYVEACWSECVWLPQCFSINVRVLFDVIFECELNNSTKEGSPESLVLRQGSVYHDMGEVKSKYCSLYECARKQVLPDGWFGLGSSALKLFTEKKNWTSARQYCKALGGELVSISSSYKDSFVYVILVKEHINNVINNKSSGAAPPTDHYLPLDGHDEDVQLFGESKYAIKKSGEAALKVPQNSYAKVPAFPFNSEGFAIAFWVYISGSPGDWTNTLISDLKKDDNTFRINRKIQEEQLIFNLFSSSQANFLTIKTAQNKIPRTVWEHLAITWNKTKGKGQILLNGNPVSVTVTPKPFVHSRTPKVSSRTHYKIAAKTAVSSLDMHPAYCFMRHLMVFDRTPSNDEIRQIMKFTEYGPWIGLTDVTADHMFSWSDGSPIGQYVPLPIYKPNTISKSASCVAMKRNGKWINVSCKEKRPFICQKPIV